MNPPTSDLEPVASDSFPLLSDTFEEIDFAPHQAKDRRHRDPEVFSARADADVEAADSAPEFGNHEVIEATILDPSDRG